MRVPSIRQEQLAPNAAPRVRIDAPADTSLIQAGRGLQQVGRGMDHMAERSFQIAQEEQAKADRASYMEADRHVGDVENSLLYDPELGATHKRGKDAIGMTPGYLAQFDDHTKKIEGSLLNDRQKEAYRMSLAQRRQGLEQSLNRHEGNQREAFYSAERESYKDAASTSAITNYRDPERIEQELSRAQSAVNQTPGLTPEMKDQEFSERRSKTYSGVIDRYLANAEIDGAEKYYGSIKDKVNGEQATRIESSLRIARDRHDAEKKANLTELRQTLSDQMRDIGVAAQMGLPITDAPSQAVLKLAFGDHEGEQKYKQGQMAMRLSGDVASMQQKSSAEILESVNSYKPTQVEGAADAAQLAGFMARSAEGILKARADDPAGYLVGSAPKTQGAWSRFAQSGSEEDRRAYVSAVRADKERLGIDSPVILPNQYAKAMSDKMSNPASAEGLATMIQQEATRWGELWPDVHAQIAKDIPDMAAVIGSGIDRSAAVTLASTAKLKESELAALLPDGVKWNDVKQTVASNFDDVRRSFPAEGARTYNAIQESATRLTASYMQAGDSQKNAVQRAYKELIGNQYEVGELRDVPFLIPKQYDANQVQRNAETLLETMPFPSSSIVAPEGVDPAFYTERATATLRDEGYWVSRGDGKGLNLYLASRPTGITKTWDELAAEAPAQTQQDRRMEAASRGGR